MVAFIIVIILQCCRQSSKECSQPFSSVGNGIDRLIADWDVGTHVPVAEAVYEGQKTLNAYCYGLWGSWSSILMGMVVVGGR